MTYHLQLANKIRNGYCVGNLWMVVPKNVAGCCMTNVGVYKTEEEASARIAELTAKQ
jgi:hypothetical protein